MSCNGKLIIVNDVMCATSSLASLYMNTILPGIAVNFKNICFVDLNRFCIIIFLREYAFTPSPYETVFLGRKICSSRNDTNIAALCKPTGNCSNGTASS